MATFKKFDKNKRPKRNTQSLLFKRKRFCRFTVTGVEEIDYKDVDTLRDFIAENGEAAKALALEQQGLGVALGALVFVKFFECGHDRASYRVLKSCT